MSKSVRSYFSRKFRALLNCFGGKTKEDDELEDSNNNTTELNLDNINHDENIQKDENVSLSPSFDSPDRDIKSPATSAIAFDLLPDEILIKIIQMLNHKDMINLTMVSKKWNEIISRSEIFLKNTLLTLNPEALTNLDKASFSRKYENLIINNRTNQNPKLDLSDKILYEFKDFSQCLKVLTIYKCKIALKDFDSFMESCTNLEELKVIKLDIKGDMSNEENFDVKISLPNLKKLKIYQSSCVFNKLNSKNIEDLDVTLEMIGWNLNENEYEKVKNNFVKFLNHCENLKTLKCYFDSLDCNEELNLKSKWTKLNVLFTLIAVSRMDNWKKMISSASNESKVFMEDLKQPQNEFVLNFIEMLTKNQKIDFIACVQ